jgi:hypothetical protein
LVPERDSTLRSLCFNPSGGGVTALCNGGLTRYLPRRIIPRPILEADFERSLQVEFKVVDDFQINIGEILTRKQNTIPSTRPSHGLKILLVFVSFVSPITFRAGISAMNCRQ